MGKMPRMRKTEWKEEIEKSGFSPMKKPLYDLADIARERPIVALFAWERFPLLKLVLPRLVNATRRIGGYLVAIDDASWDDRVPRLIKQYEADGLVDFAFVGKENRHIDWMTGNAGYGKQTARRAVFLHLMARRGAPFAICCDADIVTQADSLEVLLRGARVAREAQIHASHFCGFRYNMTVLAPENYRVNMDGFTYVLFAQNTSMALSLTPMDVMRRTEREGPPWHPGKWSLNEYAHRAWLFDQYHSCYVLNVLCQHVGVGNIGRTFTNDRNITIAQFEEDGSIQPIEGFDVPRFFDIAMNGSYLTYERYCYGDQVPILPRSPVHPEFERLKALCSS